MKLTYTIATIVALALPAPAFADEDLTPEQLEQIEELMASLRCEVAGEIEVEDGEIELDDVICGGGQFDIELNEELHIVGARAE